MAGPIAATGAISNPTRYGALDMAGEQFTGLWTQAGPYRDAATAYLQRKFYQGNRFDRIIDGLNREITSDLTDGRRPGSAVWNAQTWPSVLSFYSFKFVQNGREVVRVIADTATAVYDATDGAKTLIMTKSLNAGRTRFLTIGATLYMANGVDLVKYTQSRLAWGASVSANIASIQVYDINVGMPSQQRLLAVTLVSPITPPTLQTVLTFAGLTHYTALNGVGLTGFYIPPHSSIPQIVCPYPGGTLQADTADTGTVSGGVSFSEGQFIVDTNGNRQVAIGAQTATITDIQIVAHTQVTTVGRLVTLFLDPRTTLDVPNGTTLTMAGLTTIAALNGVHASISISANETQVSFFQAGLFLPITAKTAETGTVNTGNGFTGSTMPTWQTALGAVTLDPAPGTGAQWVNRGSALFVWQAPGPVLAPTVTQTVAPTLYPAWAATTWYAPFFVILDSNGNLQQLTTAGTTGGGAPAWNVTVGGTTADNTAVWTNLGPSAWVPSTVYAAGQAVQATFTYYITVSQLEVIGPGQWNGYYYYYPHQQWVEVQKAITVTSLFQCITGGTSGANTPLWVNGLNTIVSDATVTWKNLGTAPAWPGAAEVLSLATQVVGVTNGYSFVAQVLGKTGAAEPTWKTDAGALTTDGTESWLSRGPLTTGNTGAWTYAFSGKDSSTGDVTTASPRSAAVLVAAGNTAVIQGAGMDAALGLDTIILWRTAQGQSTLIYDDEFPNPGLGQTWTYTDTTPDVSGTGGRQLNAFISAPVSNANDPPPAGMAGPVWYLQRVWGIDQNAVVYSGGPDTLVGSGAAAFPPLNRISFQANAVKLLPINVQGGALLVFTTSGIFIILGSGTASDPFFARSFAEKINLGGYDALDVLGTQIFLMESNKKVSSLTIEYPFSPQSGYTEVGFPIGDQFSKVTTGGLSGTVFDPSMAYLSWNVQGSGETAMYVANGAGQWFRMNMVSPPESGLLWSPIGAIAAGSSAMQAIETSPGVFDLLIGPSISGPILKRDTSDNIWTDNSAAFASWDVKGVNLLCSTGQWAEVAHISTKSKAVGARPVVSVLLGEIATTLDRPWNVLEVTSPDPPNTRRSKSVYSDRYALAQNGVDDTSDCILTRFDFGTQAVGDELLEWGIFASTEEERKEEVQKA